MDKFNRIFQKSNENTTCMLFSETCRLLRLYAANLLKSDVMLAAGDNLKNLSLERRGQLGEITVNEDTPLLSSTVAIND